MWGPHHLTLSAGSSERGPKHEGVEGKQQNQHSLSWAPRICGEMGAGVVKVYGEGGGALG